MPEKKLVQLKCMEPSLPYNAGEVAGFDTETAARLVKSGKWSYVVPSDAPDDPKADVDASNADTTTHRMTAKEVISAAPELDLGTARAWLVGENLRTRGPRTTAVSALEDRIAALEAEAAAAEDEEDDADGE